MKTALAEYLRQTASWRGEKVREYPDDARNARSSAALEELAAYVESVPDEDPRLRGLSELGRVDDGVYSPGETAGHMISRYGFYRDTHSPSDFLDWIVEEEKREASAMLEEERRNQSDARRA
jgi:hypothetical protein